MSRYLGAFTDTDTQIYPPFINFTELGGGKVRITLRSPSVLAPLPGRGDDMFRQSGPQAMMEIDEEQLKLLLTEVLGKLNDE